MASVGKRYGAFKIPCNGISDRYAYVDPTKEVFTSKLPLDSLNLLVNLTKCNLYFIALP